MFCRGNRGPLGDVLRRVNEDGAISFRRTRDIAEMRFARTGELHQIPVPADLHRIPRFAWQLARALQLSPREAARVMRLFGTILTMSDEEVFEWDDRTLDQFVGQYTDHAPTLAVFGFLLGLYFILPYWEVSAGEALHCFRQMAFDNSLSYPIGGAIAIPGTYTRLAEKFGAEVRLGTGVKRIVIAHGRAVGVELSDGTTLPATIVVSTSSIRTTVLRLAGADHFPADYVDRAKKIRGSYIAVQAKIGLSRKLVKAGAIVGGVGDDVDLLHINEGDLRSMFKEVESGRVPSVVPFYCPVPTNFDPALAPPGHQLLTVCAVAPTTDVRLADPSAAWEEAMMRAIRRVVPGLDDHLLFVDRFSVEFIERWIGKEFGPAVSTAQTPDQVGRARPPVHTPIRGLYLAGCNAGGRGVGTELAASSAMECVDRILADLGRDLKAVPRRTRARDVARMAARPISWVTRA
jgi:prolycopene isomerase